MTKFSVFNAFAAGVMCCSLFVSCSGSGKKVKDVSVVPEKDIELLVRVYPTLPDYFFDNEEFQGADDLVRQYYAGSDSLDQEKYLEVDGKLMEAGIRHERFDYTDDIYDVIFYELTPAILETVKVTELSYPRWGSPESEYDTSHISLVFNFSDKEGWRRFTEENIGRKIVINVDGNTLSVPRISCPIENGVSSVSFPIDNAGRYVTEGDLKKLSAALE